MDADKPLRNEYHGIVKGDDSLSAVFENPPENVVYLSAAGKCI